MSATEIDLRPKPQKPPKPQLPPLEATYSRRKGIPTGRKIVRYPTPKADFLRSQPGTLTWFYDGPMENYLYIVQAFLDAPPDETLIKEEEKEAFRVLFASLPENRTEASKLNEWEIEFHKRSKALLDFMCDYLKINKKRFYQYVEGYILEIIKDRSEHVRRMAVDRLYNKSIEYGMKESGFKDRNAILMQEGLHYAPKPPSISINNSQTSNSLSITNNKGLPIFEETVYAINDILLNDEEQLQLSEAPTTIDINIDEKEVIEEDEN